MFIKNIISLILIIFCIDCLSATGKKDFLYIEEISYKEISIPYFISKIPEKEKLANHINKRLQHILFHDDELITSKNFHLMEKHLFIRNDSIDQAGISFLHYSCSFHKNFLQITIEIDWAGGPYPLGGETDYLHFDLEEGELIVLPDLIDGSKYFEFLEKFWFNDCQNSIREAHQCAYGNETGNYESESALTLEGECEFQCHKMNHHFTLSNDLIFISNNSKCFPRVWQNCNYGSSMYLKIHEIKEYLSDYGKWLLGFSDHYADVLPYYHFVGKINDTHNISLSITRNFDGTINGEYFFWKQNRKISLNGQISGEKLIMNEFDNNSNTGRFELEWDDFLYSTVGFWYNLSHEQFSVKLLNIYDYKERTYYR
jgi:hypothetical protein